MHLGGMIKKDAVRLVVFGMNTYIYLGTGVKTNVFACMVKSTYIINNCFGEQLSTQL